MDHSSNRALQQFRNEVGIKFQLYNSLFTSLPFQKVEKTGILLSLFSSYCEEGYQKAQSPSVIIKEFFEKHTGYKNEKERTDLLFRFVQYAERQVVLFDALEDAAFTSVNDMSGPGTLKQLESDIIQFGKEKELQAKLEEFAVRLVLTAHPTQFYPGPVLGIINDLTKALKENNTSLINSYLQQLGKTQFFKKQKPTPYDEALNLVWYLENVFYHATGRIVASLNNQFRIALYKSHPVFRMGFWPGGDRDGNPYVNAGTTLDVADALRSSIIKCYYLDVRRMKRRLTFEGIDTILKELEQNLYNNIFIPGHKTGLKTADILSSLNQIREIILTRHDGLFVHVVEHLARRVEVFGLFFASLDIRQVSTVHEELWESLAGKISFIPENYKELGEKEKIEILLAADKKVESTFFGEEVFADTIKTIDAIRSIKNYNGEEGCHRYIISHCNSALNVFEVYALFLIAGWKKEEISMDIVPLFETVPDLENAGRIMQTLYADPVYRAHIKRRNNSQTIMLGFSDGTKDGGYLMANWSIYKAKEELTKISREYKVDVIFFDGRGGPPSRGGGKTHKFYASMGKNIESKEIQLTVQGQTVSSNFGTIDSAQFNIEQLLHAGISNALFSNKKITLEPVEEKLLQELADISFTCYKSLRDHPKMIDYLLKISPLSLYSETNIASRPSKRGSAGKLTLNDLRAIPFAGSWSQLKQNVTGYFGVGHALKEIEAKGKLDQVQQLYKQSLFFKTLIDNCEMAMLKSFFPLTAWLSDDPEFGEIWNMIHKEYELTKTYLQKITGEDSLMEGYPVEQQSIQMREKIVLPLLTIQQFALNKLREISDGDNMKTTYEKLVIRCSFGIINAGRNSA